MTGKHTWMPALLTVNVRSCWVSARARHFSHPSLHWCMGFVEVFQEPSWMYQGLPRSFSSICFTSLLPNSLGSTFSM
ncbi:hypothetical protein BKA83DRAFT_4276980 [Pisolithus microcarpus]|nr:hypothetical protein BKA83DRAFT_4276980 [Pisolithus microcarpus]